jgi:hypothetical protein
MTTKEERLKQAEQATSHPDEKVIEEDDRIRVEFNGHRIPIEADDLVKDHDWLISSKTASSDGLVLYAML